MYQLSLKRGASYSKILKKQLLKDEIFFYFIFDHAPLKKDEGKAVKGY